MRSRSSSNVTTPPWAAVFLFATLLSAQCIAGSCAQYSNTTSTTSVDEERFSMIVVFKEFRTLIRLKVMCITNPFVFTATARRVGMPSDCMMPQICRRIFSNIVWGFAGEFNSTELQRMQKCLPGAVWYRELDGVVHKAEDSAFWHAEQQGSGGKTKNSDIHNNKRKRRGLQQEVVDIHIVNQFEDPQGGRSAGIAPPIDLKSIVDGGGDVKATGEKHQKVDTKLWNLDRIHQRYLPLDSKYIYGTNSSSGTGEGVTIYIVDSGIKKDHQEFQSTDGSGSRASYGYDFVEDDNIADDCDGHGTHVAGTAIGLQVGVAKRAKVVAVRILDCDGSGSISDTVAGLDWVAQNAKKPAIVILSLGIQVGSWSRVLEDAVRSLVNKYGITVVVASGNSGVDACYVAPANVPETITVAATDVDTKYTGTNTGDKESMYQWSNTGPCVDLFAPGVDIYSACGSPSRCDEVTSEAYTYASGTSMAVPMVAGVAALYLEQHPQAAPNEVSAALVGTATPGVVSSSGFKPGTANRMLYSLFPEGMTQVQASGGPSNNSG